MNRKNYNKKRVRLFSCGGRKVNKFSGVIPKPDFSQYTSLKYPTYQNSGLKLSTQVSGSGGNNSGGNNSFGKVADKVTAVAGAVSDIANTSINNAKINNREDLKQQALNLENTQFNGDNDSLMAQYKSTVFMPEQYSFKDFRNTSFLKDAGSALQAGVSGSTAGLQVGGPIGAIIGGVIGTGSSIIGSLIGRNKAKKAAEKMEKRAEEANTQARFNFSNAVENTSMDTLDRMMQNEYHSVAYGGPINMEYSGIMSPFGNRFDNGGIMNSEFNNGITKINTGDTHENNPYEGVQVGVDPEGIPNLLEEGEVEWNNYVFSDRLKVPKAIRKKYKLRGTTFAESAEEAQKESEERPYDSISRRGKDFLLGVLAESQEEVRASKLGAGVPPNQMEGINIAAFGGRVANKFAGDMWYDNKASDKHLNTEPIVLNSDGTVNWDKTYKNGSTFMKLKQYFIDNWDNEEFKKIKGAYLKRLSEANNNKDYSKLSKDDFKKITSDKKWGAGHELFKALQESNNSTPQTPTSTEPTNNYEVRRFIRNGIGEQATLVNDYYENNNTGYTWEDTNRVKIVNDQPQIVTKDNKIYHDYYYDRIPEPEAPKEITPKEVEPIKDNWYRKFPIYAGAVSVFNDMIGGNNPDYSNANYLEQAINNGRREIGYRPIGNYLTYRPFDTDYAINKLNASNASARRNVMNTSGGNRAAAMAGILAADYNYGNSVGDLYRQALEYNRDQEQKVEDFNRATNMANSEMGLKTDMFNAENLMKQASMYDAVAKMRQDIYNANRAEKIANLSNFVQSIGDLGKEDYAKEQLRWTTEKGAFKGIGTEEKIKALGGKIKRKRKKGVTI